MTQLLHWDEAPEEFDRCVLGKFLLPGLWSVSFEVRREIDVKKSSGIDGANFSDRGYTPAVVTLTGRILSKQDWNAFQALTQALHPQTFRTVARGEQRNVLDLRHPSAQLLGVDRVYLVAISSPEWDNGIATIKIECLQSIKTPKKAPKKKDDGSKGDNLNQLPPDALAGNPLLRNGLTFDETDPNRPVIGIG